MAEPLLLAIDQGTSSTRAIAFDRSAARRSPQEQQAFEQIYPASGLGGARPRGHLGDHALHHPRGAPEAARPGPRRRRHRPHQPARDHAPLGPAHRRAGLQRHRLAGPAHRRSLPRAGTGRPRERIAEKTGLRLDPYFSATKLAWILDRVPGARAAREARRACLRHGRQLSDLAADRRPRARRPTPRNASRTALFDIRTRRWDAELCELFDVPLSCLPEVRDSAGTSASPARTCSVSSCPIARRRGRSAGGARRPGVLLPGDVKSTYGTGAFLVLNTGQQLVRSRNRLLSTIAYRIGGEITYALEGSILSAGSTIQWLRDGLGIIARAPEVDRAGSVGVRHGRSVSGARVHRLGRALLGPGCARRDPWLEPRLGPG